MRRSWAPSRQAPSNRCPCCARYATPRRPCCAKKGYLAAVQVPTQRIEDGVVRMETLYARITTIRARGQTGGAEAKLAAYLNKLTRG